MSTTAPVPAAAAIGPAARPSMISTLARLECRRTATRPAFLIGAALTLAALLPYLDADTPVDELSMIAPAALVGLPGIVLAANRVWDADRCQAAAGATATSERDRTAAHLVACLVPFVVGLVFVAVTLLRYSSKPPGPDRFTALMPDGWVAAVFFGLGAMACLGGPVLGVVIARWTHRRPAPILISVGLVAAVIVFQGLFDPLRRVRVVMPWTYWGGPFGTAEDPERHVVLVGSPQWWVVYLMALCGIGVVVALRHDRDRRTRVDGFLLVLSVVVAVVACGLAMWTGTSETLVNTYEGTGASWGAGR